MVLVVNTTANMFDIQVAQRIAQFIPTKISQEPVQFGDTGNSGFVKMERGVGGFGSTNQ